MDISKLKKFAQTARRKLREQVTARIEHVLKVDSAEHREKAKIVKELQDNLARLPKKVVIDRVAYTWFNRFCALRFMDVNRYTRIGAISSAEGFSQPEILAEAKQGYIDESMDRFISKQKVFDLLGGKTPSTDPQNEAYRLLLVAVCNYYHDVMPFMFEKIDDYTELLMPDDLLSESSILADVKNALTVEICKDIEVIGWLYQFYISEKKDEIFEGLKKNQKITPENIPAATQLFTPHWIVRYLVENSLGRLWMLNRPRSRLVEQMEYYIKSEETESDFLHISTPEEIKICDPACGSGHMLVYAFDLLYGIYEEEGYETTEIPALILKNNLYGIEIDQRAGELASFALVMKARQKYRHFLDKPVQPNICVLENIVFEEGELETFMDEIGRDIFTVNLKTTLKQFKEANNFGSLICPELTNVSNIQTVLEEKDVSGNFFLYQTRERVQKALEQADYLNSKYHVVVANPPYMGGKGMNDRLKNFALKKYKDSKSDLFAMFIERNLDMALPKGMIAMITMQSWMFLSSFEKLRGNILNKNTILSMAHLGARAFDSIGGEVVSTVAFVLENINRFEYKGGYVRLVNENSESEKQASLKSALPTSHSPLPAVFFRASAADFKKIPGSPIAYWASENVRKVFLDFDKFSKNAIACQGLATSDNDRFIRFWPEVAHSTIGFECKNATEALSTQCKWFPIDKGGTYRKWYGNNDNLVNWENDGYEIRQTIIEKYKYLNGNPDFVAKNPSKYFLPGVTWGKVTSRKFSARFSPVGSLFSDAGMKAFSKNHGNEYSIAGFFNSKICGYLLGIISETLNYEQGNIAKLPFKYIKSEPVKSIIKSTKTDWNSIETSKDFSELPLIQSRPHKAKIKERYFILRDNWLSLVKKVQHLEEKNNRIFIKAYGLQDELTPDVPLEKITLTCNPHYRYGSDKSEEELEALLLADTMREFISYSVGCMFGRYSLDKPGLILANQGESVDDYKASIPKSTFDPDINNVIPILDDDWFPDDIVDRFRQLLRMTFGDEHYEENLAFIEEAIGKDIRKFFLKDFYNDHIKRYKKRPIYWLFSSPNGSFNALIYIHRYRPDTVSVVLNDYLREFREKLATRKQQEERVSISAAASQKEKTKALKEIEKLKKTIGELDVYERETLYPLATEQIEIDLDDGVKVNYNKFSKALKYITGLSMN
jgi:type II restriction/modification system DNA methylase subunit YeeA